MVYGASKTALAHPLVVPSELNGSFVDLQSEQISVEGAVSTLDRSGPILEYESTNSCDG